MIFPEKGTVFFFYFKTLNIERKEQILLYDKARLMSAFGGSIGLFLGFSMYSVIMGVYNCLSKHGLFEKCYNWSCRKMTKTKEIPHGKIRPVTPKF